MKDAKPVLIVDDDEDLLGLLEFALGMHQDVRLACSVADAMPELVANPPAALVLDLDMTMKWGAGTKPEELLERARRLPDPPCVILISADPERLARLKHVARATFLKPFSISLLEQALEASCYALAV